MWKTWKAIPNKTPRHKGAHMKQSITVAVSIPSNYHIRNKAEGMRLGIFGWNETESEGLKQSALAKMRTLRAYGHDSFWLEDCEVLDADNNSPLPDTLYIVVQRQREYEGHQGGSSWFASRAFVSRDAAKEYAVQHESHLQWHWVVGVPKCG